MQLLSSDFTSTFHNPAIVGATAHGARIAALFANAGIRVRLYDKYQNGDPNGLARNAIDQLMWEVPLPLSGQEASSLIDARNYQDDAALLAEHDLIIECGAENLDERQGLLFRLIPFFSRDVVLVSVSRGISLLDICDVLPAGMRSHFLIARFSPAPRFLRLVEIVTLARSEQRLAQQLSNYLHRVLGQEVLQLDYSENFVVDNLLTFTISCAFTHAQNLNLSLGSLEHLTTIPCGRNDHGVCGLLQQFGIDNFFAALARSNNAANGANNFAHLMQRSELLEYFCHNHKTISLTYYSDNLNRHLQAILQRADWDALRQESSLIARFIYCYLRDCWQYLMFIAKSRNMSGQQIDFVLRHGLGWQEGLYEQLLRFSPARVYNLTVCDAKQNEIKYLISDHWRKRPRSQKTCNLAPQKHPFLADALLLRDDKRANLWNFADNALVWQPKNSFVSLDEEDIASLASACNYAKNNNFALVIYHHGDTFGINKDWRGIYAANKKQFLAQQKSFAELIMLLRMLPNSLLLSISATIYDAGLAILMQADWVICDIDLRWQLSAISQDLPPLGGVMIEWLRRLPIIDPLVRLPVIHAVLTHLSTMNGMNSVHKAIKLGILRHHDQMVVHKQRLIEKSSHLLKMNCQLGFSRVTRHGQCGLSQIEFESLYHWGKQSANPILYHSLLSLLASQSPERTMSLRVYLEDELLSFIEICQQE